MTKAQKIRQLLAQGKSPAEIARKLKTSKQYVYSIKSGSKPDEIAKESKGVSVEKTIESPVLSTWQRVLKWIRGE